MRSLDISRAGLGHGGGQCDPAGHRTHRVCQARLQPGERVPGDLPAHHPDELHQPGHQLPGDGEQV